MNASSKILIDEAGWRGLVLLEFKGVHRKKTLVVAICILIYSFRVLFG